MYLLITFLPLLGCSSAGVDDKPSHAPIPEKVDYSVKESHSADLLIKRKPQHESKDSAFAESDGRTQTKTVTMLPVGLIRQMPELRYGCEVTSLAMVLNYAGKKVDKMELYKSIKKDSDPLIKSRTGSILRWGNPNNGFVGDMTGKQAGYAVFDQPMIQLMNRYLPGRAVNLSHQPFDHVLKHVSDGFPAVVWTTGDFRQPNRWESWLHGQQLVKTPLDLHAVVLVGYDANHVYLNDPLAGKRQKVEKEQFIASWKALNSRAVSYR